MSREPEAILDDRSTDETEDECVDAGRERRICFALESLDVGGAEHHAVMLATHLKQRGHEVLVGVLRDAGPLAERLRDAEIEVRDGLMPNRRGLGVVRRLARVAAAWPFDTLFVVECFYLNALLAYHKVKRSLGARACGIIHNWPSRREFSHPAWFAIRVRLMNRVFHRIAFIAERQREHYEKDLGIRFARTEVIPSGIDLERFSPGRPARDPVHPTNGTRSLRVGTVASLQRRKGHEYFLQAAAEILRRRKEVEFLVVGDGPRREELRGLAHDLGIDDHIHFLGIRDDLPELMRALDVLVLASHEAGGGHAETLPLVLLEAGATALPVVATDVGAVSDIVVDERTGFLVPQRDWQALADRVERLLADAGLRHEMGAAARERISARFNAQRMYRRFERFLLGAS